MNLSLRSIVTTELPFQSELPLDRWLLRSVLLLLHRFLVRAENVEVLSRLRDPYIVALNHNHYLESLLVPAFLIWVRGGRPIRFMSDWNFLLLPGIATLMRRAQVIPVARKPARPRFLTHTRDWLVHGVHGYPLAKRTLEDGCSVGIFPEGTINRDPGRLLRGHVGAARLSLETGVPVVPVGIRYPDRPLHPIRTWDRMILAFGAPFYPAAQSRDPMREAVLAWHAEIMSQIARLADKNWSPSRERRHNADTTTGSSSARDDRDRTARCPRGAARDILQGEALGRRRRIDLP